MSFGHNRVGTWLAAQLFSQIALARFEIRLNSGRLSAPDGTSFVPDLAVVPTALMAGFESDPRAFEEYADPVPFVVEIWSPSTGWYDVDRKFPVYQERGDAEIWRVHPFDRSVTRWLSQLDGSYQMTIETSGVPDLHALPGITIDLEALFAGT